MEAGKNCLGFISEQGSGTTDKADQGKQSFRRRCCAAVKRGHPSGVPVFRTHTLDFPGHSTVFVGETQQEMWYSVFSKGQNAGMQKQELNLLNRFILLGKTHPAEHHGMLQLIFSFGCTYTKIGTIQRRLAWPLRKDDTQNREAFHIFSQFLTPQILWYPWRVVRKHFDHLLTQKTNLLSERNFLCFSQTFPGLFKVSDAISGGIARMRRRLRVDGSTPS